MQLGATMRFLAFSLSLLIFFGGGERIFAQDADNGRRLSERWCLSRHVTSHSQSTATDATPSFESIARMEEFGAKKLAFYLLIPHPMMPNMSLSRDEAKDIAAYIVQQEQ